MTDDLRTTEVPSKVVIHYPTREVTLADITGCDLSTLSEVTPEAVAYRQFEVRGLRRHALAVGANNIRFDEYPSRKPKGRSFIRWGRIGMRHMADGAGDLDVTEAIDWQDLQERIQSLVDSYVHDKVEAEIVIQVNLKGGRFRDMPFGYGYISHEAG